MLTFKQFIAEGGNVTIGGHAAEKFAINAENRPHIQKDVKDTAIAVANSFHKEHPGHHLFGKDHKALETGSGYAGSTHHLMDPNISHEEFHRGMTAKGDTHARPGDMDFKVPHEHLEKLKAHLDKHIGKKFGPYKLLYTKNGEVKNMQLCNTIRLKKNIKLILKVPIMRMMNHHMVTALLIVLIGMIGKPVSKAPTIRFY